MKQILKSETEKICCLGSCKKKRSQNYFYINNNPLFSTVKLNICKSCINDFIGDKLSSGYMDRVKMVLAILNRPFLPELWESSENEWAKYIPQVSTLTQHKDLTFSDSKENIEADELTLKVITEPEFADKYNNIEVSNRWVEFKATDIPKLENFYQELITTYSSETPIQRNLYKNMAIAQLNADQAVASGNHKVFKESMEVLSKLMGDSNIKPVQESGVQDNGLATWGEWVKKIEETEPIPEPLDEFKDVDGIWKYISKWFIGHFAKVFGLSNGEDNIDENGSDLKDD